MNTHLRSFRASPLASAGKHDHIALDDNCVTTSTISHPKADHYFTVRIRVPPTTLPRAASA